MDDDDGLAASLTGLAGLLSAHGGLEGTLLRVAEFAVRAIPGSEAAGLTLLEADRPQTVVATHDFVRAVDEVQYADVQEGPCLSAVAEGRAFSSGNLGGDALWPRFGPRVGRLGVHSALSLPLLLGDHTLGALNVYAHAKGAFDDHAVRVGEAFAPHAAVSVYNAQMLARAEHMVDQLTAALDSRSEIDQAMGVLMSRGGLTAAEAFGRLQAMGQASGTKLAAVAEEVVAEAVRRARSRPADPLDPPRAAP